MNEPSHSAGRPDGPTAGGLEAGEQIGGVLLHRLIASDAFCSVWEADPFREGGQPTCVRVVPRANLPVEGAQERFRTEHEFWRAMSPGCAVELYEAGAHRDHYYTVTRYMERGSLREQLAEGPWPSDLVTEFAVDLAAALRDVQERAGAHGNLKPSNVFPVPGEGVLLSDFLLRLWVEGLEAGSEALRARLLHPYRAPEQAEAAGNYDPRSDIYSFGLVVLRCAGLEPTPEAGPPAEMPEAITGRLGEVLAECLAPGQDDRLADAFALVEALARMTRVDIEEEGGEFWAPPDTAAVDVGDRLAEARSLVERGMLDEALDVLEALPRGTGGIQEVLDDIERRQQECGELTREAVRLADLGKQEAALNAVGQAEKLWSKSGTLQALKSELAAAAGGDEAGLYGGVPPELREALRLERYESARHLLEKLLREGPVTPGLEDAVAQFKRGRVRKAVLANVAAARGLYVKGRRREARQHWLEAARWLPPGEHRDRLARIAAAAGRGKLRLAGQASEAPATPAPERPEAEPVPEDLTFDLQQKIDAIASEGGGSYDLKRRLLLTVFGVLIGLAVGVAVWLIWG